MSNGVSDTLDDEMPATKLVLMVGMALGRVTSPPQPTIPALQPGQRTFQVWSEPDFMGYRYLMTFELREETP